MKEIIGYMYGEKIECENGDAYGCVPMWNIVIIKRKKDMGKFKCKKVIVTIREVKRQKMQKSS